MPQTGSAALSAALLVCLLAATLAAQYPPPQAPPPAPGELARILEPIALDPDPLLAQVLTTVTYWNEIPDAAAWANQHCYLSGDALARAIEERICRGTRACWRSCRFLPCWALWRATRAGRRNWGARC